jgi:hypothetical protein
MKKVEQEVANFVVNFETKPGEQVTVTGPELLNYGEKELDKFATQVEQQRLRQRKSKKKGPQQNIVSNLPNIKKEFKPKWNWYNTYLKALKVSLTQDPEFVFKGQSNVKNPAIMQLVTKGFFTPDDDIEILGQEQAARPDPAKLDSNRHGFVWF